MRIIAGKCRGMLFEAPKGMDTRPTLDRVKEAVFGSIQFDVPGARVLDLFSGSGNMGLEAASRGAKQVICCDHSPSCIALIRENARKLQLLEAIELLNTDCMQAIELLSQRGFQADIVFLDPPYASGLGELALERILSRGLLAPGGRIFLEHSSRGDIKIPGDRHSLIRTRKYGSCAVSAFREREES